MWRFCLIAARTQLTNANHNLTGNMRVVGLAAARNGEVSGFLNLLVVATPLKSRLLTVVAGFRVAPAVSSVCGAQSTGVVRGRLSFLKKSLS